MPNKSCKNCWGLCFGLFLAIWHALWSLAIAVSPGGVQWFTDKALALHSLDIAVTIEPFSLKRAVVLVIFTFVVGYVMGWVLAWLAGRGCCKGCKE